MSIFPTVDLSSQLHSTSGVINFITGVNKAEIKLSTKQDEIPEFATWFYVNLTSVSTGASIQKNERLVNVSIEASDYPAGRFAFTDSSRYTLLFYFL